MTYLILAGKINAPASTKKKWQLPLLGQLPSPKSPAKTCAPCQFYAAVKLPTLIMEPLKTSVFRDNHNIKAKIRKFKKTAILP